MFPLDISIWERFLEKHGSSYTGFDYDVKVGTGSTVPENTPPAYVRMQDTLSKFRIDAVGYRPSQIEIIEVKPEASTVAIGQVVTYLNLYNRDQQPTLPVIGVIISCHAIPDMEWLTNQLGIDYYLMNNCEDLHETLPKTREEMENGKQKRE